MKLKSRAVHSSEITNIFPRREYTLLPQAKTVISNSYVAYICKGDTTLIATIYGTESSINKIIRFE
jgi:hypothetical protein